MEAGGVKVPQESRLINEILTRCVKPESYGEARQMLFRLVETAMMSGRNLAMQSFAEVLEEMPHV